MMTWHGVPKSEWRGFFDHVSKTLLGKWAQIEVASLDLGDQIVAEWVPLLGITYDSRNDVVDVALDRYNHVIRHPREIAVDDSPAGLGGVAIIDEDGARQGVKFKEPLMLAAAPSLADA
jgi:hypothetical protein